MAAEFSSTDLTRAVFAAAQIHQDLLDEFIAATEAKMAATVNPFARESLVDLLASLNEQRDSYVLVAPLQAAA